MRTKIIEVTPESEQRHLYRRSSDRTDRDKANRFDALILNAHFEVDYWKKLWDARPELHKTNTGGFYEGMLAAWKSVLFYVEPDNEKDGCERTGGTP